MSEQNWNQDTKIIIDQIRKLKELKGQDRLDRVRTIRFILFALQRSVSGWIEWVNNPDVMAGFSLEGLEEMSTNLAKLTETFIEYDSKITQCAQEDLRKRMKKEMPDEPAEKPKAQTDLFYVK
ncbi:MAG: hypothetical protein QG670_165 [Thermoproteota archaeon]|nr:hypothetical protein [Thermoproteota archaeon]